MKIVDILSYGRKTTIPLSYLNTIQKGILDAVTIQDILDLPFGETLVKNIILLSPNTMETLTNNNKLNSNVKFTLIKYLIRSTTRPTPLGALVAIHNQYTKDAILFDLDSEWYNPIFNNIVESNLDRLLSEATLFKNNSVIKSGNQYIYEVPDYLESEMVIQNYPVITFILDLLNHQGLTMKEINDLIETEINESEKTNKINQLIKKMINMKILVFKLNFISDNIFNYEKIIKIATKININSNLIEIAKTIEQFNKQYEPSINDIVTLEKKMLSYKKASHLINITKYEACDSELHFKNDIVNFITQIRRISQFMPDSPYKTSLKAHILNTYGENILVPISEMIMQQKSIFQKNNSGKYEEYKDIVTKKLNEYLNFHEYNSISFDMAQSNFFTDCVIELEKNFSLNYSEDSIQSCDLVFSGLVDENGKLQTNLTLVEEPITDCAGKMIGRFVEGMPIDMKNDYESYLKKCEELEFENNKIVVELRTSHKDSSVLNVLPKNKYNSYELNLDIAPSNSSISVDINDLYVYVDSENQLKLYSLEAEKDISLSNLNMLNPTINGNIYKFLYSNFLESKLKRVVSLMKNIYDNSNVQTQMFFNQLTICLPKFDFDSKSLSRFKDRDEIIKVIQNRLSINENKSNFVYYHNNYSKIILNLNCKVHQNIVLKDLNYLDKISFSKVEEKTRKALESYNDFFITEFVYGLTDKIKETQKSTQTFDRINRFPINNSELINLNLYVLKHDEAQALIHIDKLISEIFTKRIRFFYTRYKDSFPHIRLRILKENLLPEEIITIINKLESIKGIQSLTITNYFQESDRYGGINIIREAENLFCYQSSLAIEALINLKKNQQIIFSVAIICQIIVAFNYEDRFIVNKLERDFNLKQKEYRKKYREIQRELHNIICKKFHVNYILNDNTFERYEECLFEYVKKIQANTSKEKKYHIMSSLIHMYINRLFGIDKQTEEKLLVFSALFLRQRKFTV